MRKSTKILGALATALLGLLLVTTPVLAISNPTSIAFGTGTIDRYKAFYNVYETGDMLFIAETYVHYSSTPTDYTAEEAFNFALMDASAAIVYRSVSIPAYENKVVGIYQTAAQVTTLGLSTGTAYNLRITGNPSIFSTLTEGTNMVTNQLATSTGETLDVDWIDQSVATSTANPLRDFIILIVQDLEANDSPSTSYLTTVQGTTYLSSAGGNIFLDGIPNLRQFCPTAFAGTVEPIVVTAPPTTGALTSDLTVLNKLGANASTAFTNMSSWLGISAAMAGTLAFMIGILLLTFYIYTRTRNVSLVAVVIMLMVVFGAYMGLLPLAALFIGILSIIIASAYYLMGKGVI